VRAGHAALTDVLAADLQVLATSGSADTSILDVDLTRPTLWLFGNEAHGLPALPAAQVAIPIFGAAESLNLASAAAVCLYSSAFAQRR
jgi:TrmH family RNA methyltransferase